MCCPLISALIANLQSARQRVRFEEDGSGATEAKVDLEKAAADLAEHMRDCPICKHWIQ